MSNYTLNTLSIIFLPKIDPLNDYKTIACNWQTENILKINSQGYKILAFINNSPRADLNLIQSNTQVNKEAVEKFITKMVKENIIIETCL